MLNIGLCFDSLDIWLYFFISIGEGFEMKWGGMIFGF